MGLCQMAYEVGIEHIVTQPGKWLVQAVGRSALLHDGKTVTAGTAG